DGLGQGADVGQHRARVQPAGGDQVQNPGNVEVVAERSGDRALERYDLRDRQRGRFPADPGHHHAATPAGGTNGEFDLVRASGGLHHDVRPDAAGAQENLAAHVALRRVVGLGRARVYGTTSAA